MDDFYRKMKEEYEEELEKIIGDYEEEDDPLIRAYHNPSINVDRYPRTGRPITSMKFAGNNCRTGTDYLPVIRYEGHTYKTEDPKFVGTFYFYEPDSPYFLDLGNCLIAGSKLDAIYQLIDEDPNVAIKSNEIMSDSDPSHVNMLDIADILLYAENDIFHDAAEFRSWRIGDSRQREQRINDIIQRNRDNYQELDSFFRTLVHAEDEVDDVSIETSIAEFPHYRDIRSKHLDDWEEFLQQRKERKRINSLYYDDNSEMSSKIWLDG